MKEGLFLYKHAIYTCSQITQDGYPVFHTDSCLSRATGWLNYSFLRVHQVDVYRTGVLLKKKSHLQPLSIFGAQHAQLARLKQEANAHVAGFERRHHIDCRPAPALDAGVVMVRSCMRCLTSPQMIELCRHVVAVALSESSGSRRSLTAVFRQHL